MFEGKAARVEERLAEVFTPSGPVKTLEGLKGRADALERIRQAHARRGASIVLYGSRGVGKTSIAKVAMGLTGQPAWYYSAGESDTFETISTSLLRANKADWVPSGKDVRYSDTKNAGIGIPLLGAGLAAQRESGSMEKPLADVAVTPQEVATRLMESSGLVVIDEFERIKSPAERRKFAELVKKFSGNDVPSTLMIVGIADNVGELLEGHESAARSIAEVDVPALKDDDIRRVVVDGMRELELEIEEMAREQVVAFSAQYPYYTHLMCEGAVRSLLARIRENPAVPWRVEQVDIAAATIFAIENTHREIADAYEQAILSIKDSPRFKLALYAIASAPREPVKYGDICRFVGAIQHLAKGSANVSHQLDRLEGAGVIVRAAKGMYRFKNPILKAYVILKLRADSPSAELAAIDAQLADSKRRIEAVTERLKR